MALIPDDLFDAYYEAVDEFITNDFIGKPCKVFYPPERLACDNCKVVKLASGSSNQYKTGGPIPFTHGVCPYCGGIGYKETYVSDDIRLRIYWSKRDWSKLALNVQIPEAEVMTIGFLTDITKCIRCQYIQLVSDQTALAKYNFVLAGEPFPHGFGKDRYFVAYWKRDR